MKQQLIRYCMLVLIMAFPSLHYSQTDVAPYIYVLGIAQDAGYPQADCHKACCQKVRDNPEEKRYVSCISVIDPVGQKSWMIDATPDFTTQLEMLHGKNEGKLPDGIFLTHAHIGHYTGLMYLGREAMGTQKLPVYAMPRMFQFLTNNGPWEQLVTLGNISLQKLAANTELQLSASVRVTPLIVPHRDEYSETVGYLIKGPNKTALFIPDINKWQIWDMDINAVIHDVDYALIDGSFFDGDELPNRDMSEIPHPFVTESMELFDGLSKQDKAKVQFMHFNHTNPLLDRNSEEARLVLKKGFNIAYEGQIIAL